MVESKKITAFYFKKSIIFLIFVIMGFCFLSISTLTGSLGLDDKLTRETLSMLNHVAFVMLFLCMFVACTLRDDFFYSVMDFTVDDKGIEIKEKTFIKWKDIDRIEYTKVRGFDYITIRLKGFEYSEQFKQNNYFLSKYFISSNELSFCANNFNVSGKEIYETMRYNKENSINSSEEN